MDSNLYSAKHQAQEGIRSLVGAGKSLFHGVTSSFQPAITRVKHEAQVASNAICAAGIAATVAAQRTREAQATK